MERKVFAIREGLLKIKESIHPRSEDISQSPINRTKRSVRAARIMCFSFFCRARYCFCCLEISGIFIELLPYDVKIFLKIRSISGGVMSDQDRRLAGAFEDFSDIITDI